jgi:Zn-dependent alcohol dehydrogenase
MCSNVTAIQRRRQALHQNESIADMVRSADAQVSEHFWPSDAAIAAAARRLKIITIGKARFRMSRVIEFSEAGGPEVLRFKNVDVPEAGRGQVRIRVKAIGLNRAESMWRENKYIEPVKFPARLGYEAVGTVDSVGKDVTTIAVGDEVNTIRHSP